VARIVAPDLRGFGHSVLGTDPPSLDVMADDVAAMLSGLALDRVVLGGLSMGGYVAMAFLRRHPGRVDGLMLIDTKATADPPAVADGRRSMAERLRGEESTEALVELVLPKLLGRTTTESRPEVAARVLEMVRSADPSASAWAQLAMADRPDSLELLRDVDVPALVVIGDEDQLASLDDGRAMADALPLGRMETLERCGHLSALETPGPLSAILKDFVGSLPSPS
jgi:pimeloyl-ACP methyl ester carboxylesterase